MTGLAHYRPEIDGLRAIAVLSVLLYHAGVPGVQGGFAGVDVFFVISGYLITGILIREREQGVFSVLNFYERRARRILPALFLVMAVCLPAAWWLLSPDDLASFAHSVAAVPVFVSNLVFARGGGYFDPKSEWMPLLHTWSLGVEEQFYLFFPWLLAAVWSWRARTRWLLWLALAVASLALAEWALAHRPTWAFYHLLTRAWELLLGAMLASAGLDRVRANWPVRWHAALSAAGLAMVLGTVAFAGAQAKFPGLTALWPTLGAVLLIGFSHSGHWLGRVLAHRLLVSVGLISYSAYLWHQPVLAFARHAGMGEGQHGAIAACLFLTLALAWATWRWVETPFRDRARVSRRTVFAFALGGSLAFALVGLAGMHAKGFPGRLSGAQQEFLAHFDNSLPEWAYFTRMEIPKKFRLDCDFYDTKAHREGRSNVQGLAALPEACVRPSSAQTRRILLWGDSHAQQLRPGLDAWLPPDWAVLQVASSGCYPSVPSEDKGAPYCRRSNLEALRVMQAQRPDVVLIAMNDKHELDVLRALAKQALESGAHRVVWVGPSPHWMNALPKLVAFHHGVRPARHSAYGLDRSVWARDRELQAALANEPRVRYVSIFKALCTDAGCPVYLGDDVLAGLSSWDYGHLTPIASEYFVRHALLDAVTRP